MYLNRKSCIFNIVSYLLVFFLLTGSVLSDDMDDLLGDGGGEEAKDDDSLIGELGKHATKRVEKLFLSWILDCSHLAS